MILALSAHAWAAGASITVALITATATITNAVVQARQEKRDTARSARVEYEAAVKDAQVRDSTAALEAQRHLIAGLQTDNDRLRSALRACEERESDQE